MKMNMYAERINSDDKEAKDYPEIVCNFRFRESLESLEVTN